MATIKAYTDLSQSKTLSKILPLESADMYYSDVPVREWIDKTDISKGTHVVFKSEIFAIENLHNHEIGEGDVYAWSLAALLGVLPKNLNIGRPSLDSNYKGYYWIQYYDEFMKPNNYKTKCFNNPVDACYEMILKLHELNLL